MSLALYNIPNETGILTSDGNGLSAFTVTFDGKYGGAIDKQIFIRNDNLDRYYTNITVIPVDTSGDNIVNGLTVGYFWKMAEKDIPLTQEEWDEVSMGNTISFTNSLGNSVLGDISTFRSFWIRVKTPRNQNLSVIKDVVLRISATENLV